MWSSMKLVDESNWALKAKERQNAASSMVKVSEPSLAGLSASKRIIVRDSGGEIAGNIGPVAHFQLMIDVKACIFSVYYISNVVLCILGWRSYRTIFYFV